MASAVGAVSMTDVLRGRTVVNRTAHKTPIAPIGGAGALLWSGSAATTTSRGARKGSAYVVSRHAISPSLVQRGSGRVVLARAVAAQDPLTDAESEDIGDISSVQRELKAYPPGLQRYETMAVLRPDISEEQRLALTQRYEEVIIAGGGLDVEMFNRGMQPLAYNIKTKNMSGVSSRYLDGIYLLFTYVTKPESQSVLQKRLNADDDIIRSTTCRLKV